MPIADLPKEIYFEILDYLCDATDYYQLSVERRLTYALTLRSLAQTCRLFRTFILSQIFYSVRLDRWRLNNTIENPPHFRNGINLVHFFNALNNEREPAVSSAQYVKSCILIENIDSESSTEDDHDTRPAEEQITLKMCYHAICRMPNIQDLSLSCLSIDECVLEILGNLQHLASLSLTSVAFSPEILKHFLAVGIKRDNSPWKKSSPITKLDLHWSFEPSDSSDPMVHTPALLLAHLIDTATLQRLMSNRSGSIEPLLSQSPPLVLLELLEVYSTHTFWDALCGIETLETLYIGTIYTTPDGENPHHQPFSPSCFPHLKHLTGPPSVSSIATQRPLITLDLISASEMEAPPPNKKATTPLPLDGSLEEHFRNLVWIQGSGITSVRIPLEIYMAGSLCEQFPFIEDLAIQYGHPNLPSHMIRLRNGQGYLKSFVKNVVMVAKRPPAPSVKALDLILCTDAVYYSAIEKDCRYNLQLQLHLIVDLITKAFPNVNRVSFFNDKGMTWVCDKTKWKFKIERMSFFHQADLATGVYVVKDVDNVLDPWLGYPDTPPEP